MFVQKKNKIKWKKNINVQNSIVWIIDNLLY